MPTATNFRRADSTSTPSRVASRPVAVMAMAGLLALAGSAASAQVVNLGNLVTTNALAQSSPITTLTGGPYNRVTFTTNWSYNAGTPTSMGAAINFNAGPFYNILAGLSSISGFANNANPTSLSAACILSMPVSSATALTMIRGQNSLTAGYSAANWNNTTLTFSYVPPRPVPTGITYMGVRGNTTSTFSVVPGGGWGGGGAGGTADPLVGLYSREGYLLASNAGLADSSGTTLPTGMILGEPATDPGLTNLMLPEGEYFLFVAGSGTSYVRDDFAATVPVDAPGGVLNGMLGDAPWTDAPFAEGEGRWYSFQIVPAPSAVAVLGMMGVASGLRARRRR